MANKTRGYPSGAAGEHNNFFTFDANGNILTQQRYEGSTLVDNLTYQYATNSAGDLLSNRLYSVDDAVTNASLSATDMEDMPAYINATPNTSNNYTYTQIGELKSDNQEEISEIHWRVDSKISEITRTSGSAKKNLKFEYDAMGNRVAKHVYAGSVLEWSTYYVRDAQGNVMGVYEHKIDAETALLEYKLIERNIYGSAQVVICKDTVDLNITNAAGELTQATYYHARQLNHRQYSLSNHLGNVLTTLGDGKAPVDSNSDGVIDYYTAYIISVSDYSPFGVELASRTWSIEEYRNGFNGYEMDDEVKGNGNHISFVDYGYDPRAVVRWRPDPLTAKYQHISPYAAFGNNPILYVDIDGKEIWIAFEAKKEDGTTEIQKVQYKGDKLYTVDGKEYTGGNEFAGKVLKDLNQLKADDALLKERTETLEKSTNIHNIQMPEPGKYNSNTHSKVNTESHIPTGSTTSYDPDATENVSRNKRTPRVGLAHELLGHGWDADQGKKNYDKTDNGISMFEVNAVNIENRARAAAGDEKRTIYGGKEIPAKLLDDTHNKIQNND